VIGEFGAQLITATTLERLVLGEVLLAVGPLALLPATPGLGGRLLAVIGGVRDEDAGLSEPHAAATVDQVRRGSEVPVPLAEPSPRADGAP
jgi:hypothetical protein